MAVFEVLYKQVVKAKAELSTVWPRGEGMPQHAHRTHGQRIDLLAPHVKKSLSKY